MYPEIQCFFKHPTYHTVSSTATADDDDDDDDDDNDEEDAAKSCKNG
jgi:hypothetical protein